MLLWATKVVFSIFITWQFLSLRRLEPFRNIEKIDFHISLLCFPKELKWDWYYFFFKY
jgi:hypothetical protein